MLLLEPSGLDGVRLAPLGREASASLLCVLRVRFGPVARRLFGVLAIANEVLRHFRILRVARLRRDEQRTKGDQGAFESENGRPGFVQNVLWVSEVSGGARRGDRQQRTRQM